MIAVLLAKEEGDSYMQDSFYENKSFKIISEFLEKNKYLSENFEVLSEYKMDDKNFIFDTVILSTNNKQPVFFIEEKKLKSEKRIVEEVIENYSSSLEIADFAIYFTDLDQFLLASDADEINRELPKEDFLDYLEELLSDTAKLFSEQLSSGTEPEGDAELQGDVDDPYNPDEIKITQQLLSVKYMFELYEDNLIELSPDFQRQRVWKNVKQKSLLIESLILNIPIPAFYMYETFDGSFQIIDGQQRLDAIFGFLNGEYKLKGLEYLSNYEGLFFADLSKKMQGQIYRTQLSINTIDIRSPKRVVYDIFKRINTGGVPLNNQEMRNAISTKALREFYRDCSNLEEFQRATNYRIAKRRLEDQEMVLRFVSFFKAYDFDSHTIDYNYSSTARLFNETHEYLIDHPYKYDEYKEAFKVGLIRSFDLFGSIAFNKFVFYEDGSKEPTGFINKPLYTAFTVLLSGKDYDGIDLKIYKGEAEELLANKMKDHIFFNAITFGTNSSSNVRILFKEVKEVIDECLKS